MKSLLEALEECRAPTLVAVVVAYPRLQATGLLNKVGMSIDLVTACLLSSGAHVERVLHSMIVALLTEAISSRAAVALASSQGSNELIEVRTIMVPIATRRNRGVV